MMIVPALVLFFLLYFLIYYFLNGKKVRVHRVKLAEMKRFIELLYFRGFHQSGIVISIPNRIECVQYAKFLKEGSVVIYFLFPLVEWAKKYLKDLEVLLDGNNYKFRFEDAGYGNDFQNLIVEFSDDLDNIIVLTRILFSKLYKVGDEEFLNVHFLNINPENENVGDIKLKPSHSYLNSPAIALTNAEHWGLQVGFFIGSLLRFIMRKK